MRTLKYALLPIKGNRVTLTKDANGNGAGAGFNLDVDRSVRRGDSASILDQLA